MTFASVRQSFASAVARSATPLMVNGELPVHADQLDIHCSHHRLLPTYRGRLKMEMFRASAVRHNPADLELVREVTLQDLSDWLLLTGAALLPEHLSQRVRNLGSLKEDLSPLFDGMREGDSLWLCRSRFRAPLFGHEGIARVRDGLPVVYVLVTNH